MNEILVVGYTLFLMLMAILAVATMIKMINESTKHDSEEIKVDYIQSYLENGIDKLKPEIRKRFVYQFLPEDKHNRMADCRQGLIPPLITFYPFVIAKAPDLSDTLLDELIKHEIIHTFYHAGEDMATDFQKRVNFNE